MTSEADKGRDGVIQWRSDASTTFGPMSTLEL